MGEAKRRKELGLPPKQKTNELDFPKLDKLSIQKKVRSLLYKYPIIPFLFYAAAIAALAWGVFNLLKVYKFI